MYVRVIVQANELTYIVVGYRLHPFLTITINRKRYIASWEIKKNQVSDCEHKNIVALGFPHAVGIYSTIIDVYVCTCRKKDTWETEIEPRAKHFPPILKLPKRHD